jgi:uncharacterized protein (UPF0335 family)
MASAAAPGGLAAFGAAPLKGGRRCATQGLHRDNRRPGEPSMPNDTYTVAADELRQFIEQYEHLEAEKKDIAEQQKDVMSEAKARGYDTKVLKKIIAIRKRDKNDLAEEEAIMDIYKAALGMS